MSSLPLVSVCMTTYFHGKYIRQALDSVLAQQTAFPFEICISDDASSDETPDILKEYASKHDNIFVNLNEINLGLTKNFDKAYRMCRGQYIVDLSGDDYYLDPHKLQKQVDFLKSHPEYIGVATSVAARYDDEETNYFRAPDKKFLNKDFTLKMFMKGHNYPLNGIMVKNLWLTDEGKEEMKILVDASEYIDDITLCIKYLQKGNVFILPDITTVYRIQRSYDGKHNFNSLNKGLVFLKKHIANLDFLRTHIDGLDFFYRYKEALGNGFMYALKCHGLREYRTIYKGIPKEYKRRMMRLRILTGLAMAFPEKCLKAIKRSKS